MIDHVSIAQAKPLTKRELADAMNQILQAIDALYRGVNHEGTRNVMKGFRVSGLFDDGDLTEAFRNAESWYLIKTEDNPMGPEERGIMGAIFLGARKWLEKYRGIIIPSNEIVYQEVKEVDPETGEDSVSKKALERATKIIDALIDRGPPPSSQLGR